MKTKQPYIKPVIEVTRISEQNIICTTVTRSLGVQNKMMEFGGGAVYDKTQGWAKPGRLNFNSGVEDNEEKFGQ